MILSGNVENRCKLNVELFLAYILIEETFMENVRVKDKCPPSPSFISVSFSFSVSFSLSLIAFSIAIIIEQHFQFS